MRTFRTVRLTVLLLAGACARTDYLYLGSSECESFACLATPGFNGGYCSQACAGAGARGPAGLTCSQLNLSSAYLDAMKQPLPPDRYTQLFGQLNSSWYCVRAAR
jgi:hypothetical protein